MALAGIPDLPSEAFKHDGNRKIKPQGGDSPPPAPTSQTVTQTSIPEYARPTVERMIGKAEALSNAPYQAYGGERLAGFTPMQQQAMQGVANLQPSQQLGTATQLAGLGGLGAMNAGNQYNMMATNPYAMQAYMSPYIQNALNPQMEEARRQSNITGQMNAARAVQQGAFGGSGSALVEAERQRNLGTNLANIYGTGMQNAFQNAQQAQQFGATLGLQGNQAAIQGASTLGQLGQTQFGQQKDILNAQMNAGAQQQALQQQKLTQQYQDFLNQKNYDKQNIAFLSDVLRGVPLSQQTQATYQAPPSMGAQLGGAALGYLGAKQAGIFAKGGRVHGLDKLAIDQLMKG
jgi:hypothetical protein